MIHQYNSGLSYEYLLAKHSYIIQKKKKHFKFRRESQKNMCTKYQVHKNCMVEQITEVKIDRIFGFSFLLKCCNIFFQKWCMQFE